eukprot:scaffold3806_cov169-Amphora_coffeaeformis.AAC.14
MRKAIGRGSSDEEESLTILVGQLALGCLDEKGAVFLGARSMDPSVSSNGDESTRYDFFISTGVQKDRVGVA